MKRTVSFSGYQALMIVLYTKPSARRNISLFVNSRSILLNAIVYSLMPKNGSVKNFKIWHRAFGQNRITNRPKRKTKGCKRRILVR